MWRPSAAAPTKAAAGDAAGAAAGATGGTTIGAAARVATAADADAAGVPELYHSCAQGRSPTR